MPRGGRMDPEPVPSGSREKKLIFPWGDMLEPVYPKKVWVDPKKG